MNSNKNINITWFLSGGKKYDNLEDISEAEKMANKINLYNKNTKWNIVYDKISTNTAENFIMAQKYIKEQKMDEIYVITSQFHYERANKILEKIFTHQEYLETKWILSSAKMDDSEYWEKIHINNVENDVSKALRKFI